MCRWLAYSGAPLYLEDVVLNTPHSLIDQSLEARFGETPTNGDGFGIGWYGDRAEPGVYRDIRPAWNDSNLKSLAGQIRSGLFLAHVRAATGTAVQRSNCHPFRHGRWLFVHNGGLAGFRAIKRDLAMAIAPELFADIEGTTDSEIMFRLALTLGMEDDVRGGIARMVGLVETVAARHGIEHPVQMSLGISDGECLYAVRYSSAGASRTLFYSAHAEAAQELAPQAPRFHPDARAIVSEPLTNLIEQWVPVPEASFITVRGAVIEREPFAPDRRLSA